MKKFLVGVMVCSALILAGCEDKEDQQKSELMPELTSSGDVVVAAPLANSGITSPLTITGEAVGNWYFEASFPIKLVDTDGNILASTIATAQGDWMTTDLVPFEATMVFNATGPLEAELLFEKDNPSGLPENAGEYSVPVNIQ